MLSSHHGPEDYHQNGYKNIRLITTPLGKEAEQVMLLEPILSEKFPTSLSPLSHNRSPFKDSDQDAKMYRLPHGDLHLFQTIERNDGETPTSSRSLRAFSTESVPDQVPQRPEKLRFLRLDEWDEGNSYAEEVPTYLHYS
jgi:hypothetical protein